MQRMHTGWYLGTADAVYQNIASIFDQNPTQVLIVAGDHIYKMNYYEMLYAHRAAGAAVTVATLQADPAETARFGVADIDPASHLIRGFQEKPDPASAVSTSVSPGWNESLISFRTQNRAFGRLSSQSIMLTLGNWVG